MTLSDCLQKAKTLYGKISLSDFKGFETGSGLYIMKYNIDDDFSLVVGGTAATGKPMYAYLTYGDGEHVDIMTEDAEVFISGHS